MLPHTCSMVSNELQTIRLFVTTVTTVPTVDTALLIKKASKFLHKFEGSKTQQIGLKLDNWDLYMENYLNPYCNMWPSNFAIYSINLRLTLCIPTGIINTYQQINQLHPKNGMPGMLGMLLGLNWKPKFPKSVSFSLKSRIPNCGAGDLFTILDGA